MNSRFYFSIAVRRACLRFACAVPMLIAGCASPVLQSTFQAAPVDDSQIEETLNRLRADMLAHPSEPIPAMRYLGLKERAIDAWLRQADLAAGMAANSEAARAYRRVLSVDATNPRARAGLTALDRANRHAGLMQAAKDARDAKDSARALDLIKQVLSEAPEHPGAQALLGELEHEARRPVSVPALDAALRSTVSIDFKNAALQQVFEVLSRTAGINFVFDKEVNGEQKTSLSLKNTSVKDALEVLLLTNQLERRVLDANTVLIYPSTPAKQKDYQALMVRSFFLANADIDEVANALKTLVKTRDLIVSKKQNLIVIRDTPEAVRVAEKIVALHDLPEPEVMLQVEILEVNRSRLTELGIKYPEQLSLTPLPSTAGATLTLRYLKNLNSERIGATTGALTINALGQDADVNLLANPRIRVRNRDAAKILIGDKVPNITSTSTSTGFLSENVQYLDVGLKLEVTPVISIDDEIAIKISLEVSNIVSQVKTSAGTLAYQIGTRSASTVLRLKDGENQILAGLINSEDRRSLSKIPGLGDIPIAGRLFSSQLDEARKTEIVLSITPRLIRNTPRPAWSMLTFDAGTESSTRSLGFDGSMTVSTPALRSLEAAALADATQPAASGAATAALESSGAARALPTPSASASGIDPTQTAPLNAAAPVGAGSAASAAPPGLRWQGPQQVKAGDTFAAQLWLSTPEPIAGMPFIIGFDPAAFEVINVVEGELLKQGGAKTTFNQRVDSSTGQIFITQVRNGGTAAVGSDALVNLTLKARPGATAGRLQVVSTAALGLRGEPVNLPLPSALSIVIQP